VEHLVARGAFRRGIAGTLNNLLPILPPSARPHAFHRSVSLMSMLRQTTNSFCLASLSVSTAKLLMLLAVFFMTSVISVVTGSTSLLTVPVMISLGIEPHAAVATNMLALVFMSVSGSLSFIRRGLISQRYLPISILLTVVGSGLGALLLLAIPVRALQLCIALAMITVGIFTLANPHTGFQNTETPVSRWRMLSGYLVTFLLAVYGGFFSGGYVTMLTASWIVLFGMTFLQSVATTKVVNIFPERRS
jgi:uncharacterized membrane protein YfcA